MKNVVVNAFSAFLSKQTFDASSVNDTNVNEFLKIAFQQKITAITIHSLLSADNSLSDSFVSKLKLTEYQRITSQTKKSQMFLSVYKKMLDRGIKPLCVKGIMLNSLYPFADMRECSDEDILVKDSEFQTCKDVLSENDFEFVCEGINSYVLTYMHKKSGCMIDVHRTLFPVDDEMYISYNNLFCDIFADFTQINIGEHIIYCPSADKQILYLILHSFKHFLVSGIGIRQVADISLFSSKNDINWNGNFKIFQSLNLDDFVSALLLIGNRYFSLPLDRINSDLFNKSVEIKNLLDDIMNGGVYGSSNEDHIRSGNLLAAEYKSSLFNEKKSLFSSVFPSYDKMKSKYSYLNKHPILLPFAYCNRVFDYFSSEHNFSETVDIAKERKKLLAEYNIIRR